MIYGNWSKPCIPCVNTKRAGAAGCSTSSKCLLFSYIYICIHIISYMYIYIYIYILCLYILPICIYIYIHMHSMYLYNLYIYIYLCICIQFMHMYIINIIYIYTLYNVNLVTQHFMDFTAPWGAASGLCWQESLVPESRRWASSFPDNDGQQVPENMGNVWEMIGLRDTLQKNPIFHGKIYGFL